jgi:hypothetical protein
MTIEAASEPRDLAAWDPGEQPFYLELYGETRPVVDTAYAEVIPASSSAEASPVSRGEAPVYEYWWTIGHPGAPQREGRVREWLHRLEHAGDADRTKEFWADLPDPAARVYVYFPRDGGWRVKEVVASVKYLSPAPQQKDLSEKVAEDWQFFKPLVEDASTLAGVAGPEVGVPVKGTVATLNALAGLKLGSIPQGAGMDWSVGKVTFGHSDPHDAQRSGVMQGVVWELPAKMFTELGGRLTGSLAVSYIPCRVQGADVAPAAGLPPFQPRAILTHAVVYAKGGHRWVPSERGFVRLNVAPEPPAAQQAPPASSGGGAGTSAPENAGAETSTGDTA